MLTSGGGLANLPNWPMLALPLPLQALREQERSQRSRKGNPHSKEPREREANGRIEHVPRAGLITERAFDDGANGQIEIAAQ